MATDLKDMLTPIKSPGQSTPRTYFAQIFVQNMTKMQGQIGVQPFDMWHDYMNLGSLLKRLHEQRPEDHEAPKRSAAASEVAAGAPGSHTHTKSRKVDRISTDASSVSSLSDASSSVTSSDADFCRFCKQNGESPRVYRSHTLKSADSRVVCPILWNYICPICGATGDYAHTRRYCPVLRRQGDRKLAGSKFC